MAIEIRELVIKTTIVERPAADSAEPVQLASVQKEEILSACRQLILSLLRERGER